MSTTTRYTARILSAILTLALQFTSGVTPIFAAELNNQLLTGATGRVCCEFSSSTGRGNTA